MEMTRECFCYSKGVKLYLTSYNIPTPHDFCALVGKAAGDITLGVIANAKDYYAPRPRAIKLQKVTDTLHSFGFSATLIDLRDYHEQETLRQALMSVDALWVAGGNTFCLRYEMHRSGFEAIIHDVLASGVVYGGESAGAVVAGRTLRGIELADVAEFAEEVIWEGLGLTEHVIVPHVGSSGFGGAIEEIEKLYVNDPTAVKLTDSQAYVIDERQECLVEQPPLEE